MAVVLRLDGGVDAADRGKALPVGLDLDLLAGFKGVVQPLDGKSLFAGQAQRAGILAG